MTFEFACEIIEDTAENIEVRHLITDEDIEICADGLLNGELESECRYRLEEIARKNAEHAADNAPC